MHSIPSHPQSRKPRLDDPTHLANTTKSLLQPSQVDGSGTRRPEAAQRRVAPGWGAQAAREEQDGAGVSA